MQLKKNDDIKLKIENSTLDGSGIGRYDGMTVFARPAVRGDEVTAHILKVKSSYAYASVKEIEKPSPYRISAPCPVYGKCGGCCFCHLDYAEELRIKQTHVADCLRRIGGIEPEIEEITGSEKIYGYRNKAQYPVEINGDKVSIGFYANHSHRVVNCPSCSLQPPEFEIILRAFTDYIVKKGTTSYNEETGSGLLRHIYLRKGTASGEIMVCPVINADKMPDEDALVKALTGACENIKSIVVNSNKEKTNVILGKHCRTLYGSGYITDTLCGLTFRLSPLSFYQVNRDQAEKLYMKAAEYAALTGKETLLDLYCGTGTIGLSMASKAREVIGVEIVENAVEDAKTNAKLNNISNASFICADAAQAAEMLREKGVSPQVVIIDPPRKGCSPAAVKIIAEMSPRRVVYISCDPATLARDCKLFEEFGFRTLKAAPFDMFSRAGHVETVVLMIKN